MLPSSRYTPDELKYLPLNTVSYGPILEEEQQLPISEDSDSDSTESSSSDDSS
jgi:hypothetical protein